MDEQSVVSEAGRRNFFLPAEESVAAKLNNAALELKMKKEDYRNSISPEEREERRRHARQLADHFINQKVRQHEAAEKERQDIHVVDEKIRRIKAVSGLILKEKQDKQNRSADDKITAANKLKSQLKQLRKMLKFHY